jgi:hypothetical protein
MIAPRSSLRTIVNSDGAAILDLSHNRITTLNSTGGFIWQKLQEGCLVGEVISELARESNTDHAIIECDVVTFLGQLRAKDLLQS